MIQYCKSEKLKSDAISSKEPLTAQLLIEMGRLDESVNLQAQQFKIANSNVNMLESFRAAAVDNVNTQSHQRKQKEMPQQNLTKHTRRCRYCGDQFPHIDGICKARGATCSYCQRLNHLEIVCQQKKFYPNPTQARVQHVRDQDRYYQYQGQQAFEEDRAYSWNVTAQAKSIVNSTKNFFNSFFMPTVLLLMCQGSVLFNVDTGSQVDIVDEYTFQKLPFKPRLEKCSTSLFGYSSEIPIKTLGQFTTRVLHKGVYKCTTFLVTAGNAGNLLSYKSAVKLGVLQEINQESRFINMIENPSEYELIWINKYPNLFSGKIGKYEGFEANLHIDKSVSLRHEKLRPVPFHLRSKVECQA